MHRAAGFFVVLALLAPGCAAAWGERELAGDEVFEGTAATHRIPAASTVATRPDGTLDWTMLARPAWVQDIEFPLGTTLHFDADGHLVLAEFGEPIEYQSMRIAADNIPLHPSGVPRVFTLVEPAAYRGYWLQPYSTVELYADGVLKAASLGAEELAFGDAYVDSTVLPQPQLPLFTGWTTFYPNGRVETGFASRVFVSDGVPYAPGHRLEFAPTGAVRVGVLASGHRPRTIQGVDCEPGSPVWFHENGRLRYCKLGDDAVLGGDHYRRGQSVAFDRDGEVFEWAPFESYASAVEFPVDTLRHFDDEDADWGRTRLRRTTTINGYPCQAWSDWEGGDLELDEHGNLRWCILARDVRVHSQIVAAGSQLSFADGQPHEAHVRRVHATDSGVCGPDSTLAFDGERVTCGWEELF